MGWNNWTIQELPAEEDAHSWGGLGGGFYPGASCVAGIGEAYFFFLFFNLFVCAHVLGVEFIWDFTLH